VSKNIVIEASDLTKFYGETLAIDHINFAVEKGEILGFLGPNGAGKTTTIRMLTGLSKPSDGKASVLGFDVNTEIVEAKRYIGVVTELSNLYDELTALDNLLFMAQLYGVPRSQRRRRAEELLTAFNLYERKDSPLRTFSRGMKRALTVAAALIHSPKILFLDEPTVGLDVVAARSLRNLIGNLRQEGITIFLTTHYLEEADFLCERIAILVKGRIIEIDTPRALKATVEEESVIEFSFAGEASNLTENLSDRLPEVTIVLRDHNRLRISGGAPSKVYECVCQVTKARSIELLSVNSIKPTLEDAYIKITGLSPTVMVIEKGTRQNVAQ
jgi:ABC-2 type transport system ATP-binding protein